MFLDFISVYLFISVIMTVFLAAYVQSRGGSSYLKGILYLALVISIYMYGYSQELNADSMKQLLFWNYFQYLGIPFVSALWLTIALIYTGHFYPLKLWKLLLVFAIPLISLFFRFTNDTFHMYFTSVHTILSGDRLILIKEAGPWEYVQAIHSGVMVLTTLVLFISSFIFRIQEDTPKVVYMLIASLLAISGLILNILNPGNLRVDYMVLLLPLTVTSVIMAILRYDFLEIKTLARNMVFERSSDGMILLDKKKRIINFNKAAEFILKRSKIELKEEFLSSLLKEEPHLLNCMTSSCQCTWISDLKGDRQYFEISFVDIFRDNGSENGRLITIRNITERQVLHENLKKQASTDELSGLLNRREFINMGGQLFQRAIKENQTLCLLMIDIDFFKKINDQFGHSTGDFVIHTMGDLFHMCFRKSDIIGRLGGEEFAVLLESTDRSSSLKRAEKFRVFVEEYSFDFLEKSHHITISIGLAYGDGSVETLEKLLQNADMALYNSKNSGRNRCSIYH